MTGPEPGPDFAFEVRPPNLATYAQSLEARAAELAAVGASVGRVEIEPGWFGELPQSGLLADRYARHREGELSTIGTLAAWLAAAGRGLTETASRYSAADRVVADLATAAEAKLSTRIADPAGTHR